MKHKMATIILGVTMVGLGVAVINSVVFGQRIYPGVKVGIIEVGGKTGLEAERALTINQKQPEKIVVTWGNTKWTVMVDDLGLEYNPRQTVLAAMEIGRQGNIGQQVKEIYQAGRYGRQIALRFTVDESKLTAAVKKIADQVNVPASEPEVKIDKAMGTIVVTAGENGQALDEQVLRTKIKQNLTKTESEPLDAPIVYLRPKLSPELIEIVRKRAETLLGRKINITMPVDNKEWLIDEEVLVSWLDPQYSGWKRDEVENWIGELAQTIDRPAQNANFRFMGGGKVEEFKPEVSGYRVLQSESVDKIMAALINLESTKIDSEIELAVSTIEPEVGIEDVNNLGIKELIGRGESWFSGSITNRIYNLARAAATMNGVLVAPGEVFSFNRAVGDISTATGYKQAYIIKGGKTILGDGGGVCQTSTTLFRAVLAAGLPIEERTAHAYRVSYYEEKYQPGFDATVFQPAPDFKFTNDTGNYILIQTIFDEKKKHLMYELYGTSDGRKAVTSKSRMWEVTPPPPDLYVDDPNLPVGRVIQTEHAAWGAKVAFDWTVTRGEEVLQQRTFYSNYLPWQAVYLRGTKI